MNIQARWKKLSSEIEPIAYQLKHVYPDRWVRFHSLPGSKRYPETEAEYQTIIDRNKSVLYSLINEESEMIAFVPQYDVDDIAHLSFQDFSKLVERTEPYGVVSSSQDSDENFNIYYAKFPLSKLPALIRLVADDVLSNVILVSFSDEVIYHPYDGGMDLILKSKSKRDALKNNFIEWYPSKTSGY